MPTMSQKAPKRLAFPRNPAFMVLLCSAAACLLATMMIMTRPVASFVVPPPPQQQQQQHPRRGSGTGTAAVSGSGGVTRCSNSKTHPRFYMSSSALSSSSAPQEPTPSTFREAEVLGLKLMQEGDYEMALQAFQTGLKLPGSRSDVVRTKSLSGPSPVGGAMGGLESNAVQSLDEFELQAAHYNMACAHAQLGQIAESIASLESAFLAGFDNYATVRGDPDLDPVKKDRDFEKLMEKYEPKKGFNPFGLFGGNK